jgi:hypothetical protein
VGGKIELDASADAAKATAIGATAAFRSGTGVMISKIFLS